MPEPRIWYDPTPFSWGRVLRIGGILVAPLPGVARRPPLPAGQNAPPAPRPSAPPRAGRRRGAADTRDARVYALAFHACGAGQGAQRAPSCPLLSVDAWTRLDPDNAVPWLAAAAQAEQRQDSAGVAEAIRRAARAQRSD